MARAAHSWRTAEARLGIEVAHSTVAMYMAGAAEGGRRLGGPSAGRLARQMTAAFPWNEAAKYLIRDRDGTYGHAVTRVSQPWASVTARLLRGHRGRTGMRKG
jgi:hypothetical protein